VEDEGAVPNHLEVWPAMTSRRLESREKACVLRLVVGGGAMSRAHGRAPYQSSRSIRASYADDAGARSSGSWVAPRPAIKGEDVDVSRRRGRRGTDVPTSSSKPLLEVSDDARMERWSVWVERAAVGEQRENEHGKECIGNGRSRLRPS
jgi:hypothetical protein